MELLRKQGKVRFLGATSRNAAGETARRAASWDELNAQLLKEYRIRRERKLWGHTETIAERFERDREKLLPLPPAA